MDQIRRDLLVHEVWRGARADTKLDIYIGEEGGV